MGYSPSLSERIYSSTKPEYTSLVWRPASHHILVHDEHGMETMTAFLQKVPPGAGNIEVLSAPRVAHDAGWVEQDIPAAVANRLATATMATALYACGTQAFLSRIRRAALKSGFPKESVGAQQAGPAEWDVQCAYCKQTYHNTMRRIIRCEACDIDLLVRNHYSIAIGAYQGVFISPQDPIFEEARRAELA